MYKSQVVSNSVELVQVSFMCTVLSLKVVARAEGEVGLFLFCTDPVAIVPLTAGSARLLIKKASLLCSSAVMLTKPVS